VGLVATNRLRADLMLHCLRLDPSFHNARTPGELIERIDGDVAKLGNFFARFVVQLLGNAVLLVGVLIVLFGVDWRVGGALTAFALVSLVILYNLRDVAVPHWTAARQASAELFGFLEERLAGTEDIRSSGATAYAMRRLFERARALLHAERKAGFVGSTMWGTTVMLFTLGMAVALALGAYLFRAGAITLGTVFLIFSYAEMLNRPIEQITHQIQDLQEAGAGMTRVQELLAMRSAIVDGTGPDLPPGALSVAFRDVTFGYAEDAAVLHGLSFYVQPARTLGLLGRTGSGKTTIARLLLRLYDPDAGVIQLGGVDLRTARVADVRRRVGMVTQDIQLFHATVRDNLTFFDRSISDAHILRVLSDVGLWEWYQALPHGLDTRLASGGGGLSAGEAQLLAFTRVFLKDPGLVILDEASSRLDPATERRVEHAVARLLEGRTGIIIAHRLATLGRVDEIIVLEDGRIREHGPREQLAHDPRSRFAQLLQTGHEEALA
jgi:ABC-type multidrug transport system fused ATPase/permease subunit